MACGRPFTQNDLMDELYRLIFRGEVLDGQHPAVVRRRLKSLLKVDDERADVLFAGHPVVLRKEADARTAARFRTAFKEAGARLRVVPVAAAASQGDAAGPGDADGKESSRRTVDFEVAEPGVRLAPDAPPPPSPPDTSHLSVADLGTDLMDPGPETVVDVAEVNWDLAPPGTALGVEIAPVTPAVNMDDVDFEIDEPGVRMDQRRKKLPPAPPDTSHLTVESAD